MAAGALDLASPEVRINLESPESSDPLVVSSDTGGSIKANEKQGESIGVIQKALLATNSLVEEFMLLANCSVAARINESFPQTAVLRYCGASRYRSFGLLNGTEIGAICHLPRQTSKSCKMF